MEFKLRRLFSLKILHYEWIPGVEIMESLDFFL